MILNPIVPWCGSKTRMRKHILPILARYKRSLYVEPFGGAGGLLFGKPLEENEVYNDANGLMACMFRVVRNKEACLEMRELLRLTPKSREFWYELRDIARAYFYNQPETFAELKVKANLGGYSDELVAAYCVFYCQAVGFGGKFLNSFGGGTKGERVDTRVNSYIARCERLPEYCARLRRVTIENLDFADCVAKYDDPQTLFYFDPPYDCETTKGYKSGWTRESSEKLVETIKNLKGRFVLSCYDTDVYQSLESIAGKAQFSAFASTCMTRSKETGARVETLYFSPEFDYDESGLDAVYLEGAANDRNERLFAY